MKLPVLLLVVSAAAAAQVTQVDLRTQSKSVDFSAAVSTKPVTIGTALPATCSAGQMFFKTNAPPGTNLYGCASANTWTALNVSSGSPSALPFCADTGTTNAYACNLIPAVTGYTAGLAVQIAVASTSTGPVTLNLNSAGVKPVVKYSNQPIGGNDIQTGQVITVVYDGVSFQMASQLGNYLVRGPSLALVQNSTSYPNTIDIDTNKICIKTNSCAPAGAFDLSGSSATKPSKLAAADPANCAEGESYYNTTSHKRRDCVSVNTWGDPAGGNSTSTLVDWQKQTGAIALNGTDLSFFSTTMPANTLAAGKCLDVNWGSKHGGTLGVTHKLIWGAVEATVYSSAIDTNQLRFRALICNDPGSTVSQQIVVYPFVSGSAVIQVAGGDVQTAAANTASGPVTIKYTANGQPPDTVAGSWWNVQLLK